MFKTSFIIGIMFIRILWSPDSSLLPLSIAIAPRFQDSS
jgi:hypothetical protein